MVEVDEHRPVGDDALLPDLHELVGGDRALLAEHRLVADLDDPLVTADLRPVPKPDEATKPQLAPTADLELEPPAEEDESAGLPPSPGVGEEPPPQVPEAEAAVLAVEHLVLAEEAQ